MGLFDIFRVRKQIDPAASVALAYQTCYQILPPELFAGKTTELVACLEREGTRKLHDLILNHFHLSGSPLNKDALHGFDLYAVDLKIDKRCLLIVYPLPPAQPVQLPNGMAIPAPYFSAIVYSKTGQAEAAYYVLEQHVSGDGTVYREVTRDAQFNLGNGCAPNREAFISLLKGG